MGNREDEELTIENTPDIDDPKEEADPDETDGWDEADATAINESETRESLVFCGAYDPDNISMLTDEEALSYLVLVNNCNRLPSEFIPGDLSPVHVESWHVVEGTHHLMRETAARAAEDLFQAAEAEGLFLIATSGYRSYALQTVLHTQAINDWGPEEARRRSAVPGHSEHQLGLALDISTFALNGELVQALSETSEGIWLHQNAHRFGFIVSYPKGRETDTGFIYEPWHIRYVGVEAATEIVNNRQILEEFLW
jgi:LAS superfamily LD-carboxypeptidase LdcB